VSNCVTLPNFVAISQTIAEISQFFGFFKMAAAAILDFKTQIDTRDAPDRSKFVILKIQDGGGRYVKKIEKSTYQLRFERF